MAPKGHKASSTSPSVIGVDIGKEVFHLVGFSPVGEIVFRRKIKRQALADTFKGLAPCIVGMEACLSAHFVSRMLRALGHEPRIIPAIYVKPFIKGQKNDYNDAEASPKRRCGPTCGRCARRPRRSLISRPITASARAWSLGARRPSTRSGPS